VGAQGQGDVSEYVGGKLLVVTTVTPDGQVTQIASCREETEDLPPVMRDMIKKDLNRPGNGQALTEGSHMGLRVCHATRRKNGHDLR
jgi:hypothetical protein